ncbi:hypothetical protein D1872_265220 [compost metagenome]
MLLDKLLQLLLQLTYSLHAFLDALCLIRQEQNLLLQPLDGFILIRHGHFHLHALGSQCGLQTRYRL